MEQYEWLVFTCRACRGVIKLSPGMGTAKHVICPRCRTKVSVPKDAVVVREEPAHNPIPAARSNDEQISQLRGKGREEWEVGHRPTGGDIEFRERLHDTSAANLQKNAADQPEVHRVNMKRRKHEQTRSDFDDPEHATRRRSSRRKLRSNGQAFNRTFVRGLVIAVIILACVAGWLGWKQFPQLFPDRTSARPAVPAAKKLETRSMAEYGPALRDTIRRFVSAPTIDEILPLVRDRERVEPKIRSFYTAENPWKPIEVNNKFEPGDQFTVDGNFIVLQLVLANFDVTPISLEQKGETFLVDWESFTGYGEMSWAELMEKRPTNPVLIRAVVEKSRNTDYFNDAFANPQTHNCYLVRDASSQHIISGYTVKDSPPDTKLRLYLQKLPDPADKFSAFAVLRVRYPAGTKGPHQVEIVEHLENGWVFRPDRK